MADNEGEYLLAESMIIYRPRFPGRIGEWLMSLFRPPRWGSAIFMKRLVGEERNEMAARISKIDLSQYRGKDCADQRQDDQK